MASQEAITDFIETLRKRVHGEIRTDQYSRILYSTDASMYQVMPYGVLLPKSTDDVQAAVELAAERRIPILPRTGGSSLAGQAVNEALIIDMSRHLDSIVELNEEEKWVRVEPGLVLDELNLYLRDFGLHFGPDPASSNRACMGGIVANNSTGSHSIVYGMAADHVLEMNLLLSDGAYTHFGPLDQGDLEQFKRKNGLEGHIYREVNRLAADPENQEIIGSDTPKHWRRCGGYNLDRLIDKDEITFKWPRDPRFNLADLISGSEGTLGVITELKLNLVKLPTATALAIVHFDDLYTALSAVPAILELKPSAVELLDNLGLTLCRDVPAYARLMETFIKGEPYCVLITEFYGQSKGELQAKISNFQTHLTKQAVGAVDVTPVFSPQIQNNIWTVRKVGLGFIMSIKGDHKPVPFIEDAAVAPEHLAEYVTKIENFCTDLGTNVAYYAHASAGCVHIRPLINAKSAQDVAKMPEIARFSVDLLHGYQGSFSSEHGDGRARSWLNEYFFGRELYSLYKEVKAIFDPDNILNPGNIVDGPSMTEELRFGDSYQVVELKPHIDFSFEHGFNRAIEMCNGAGVCRKKTTGTMCPSFMVTRDEEHSTRGRANALRAALSGQLPAAEFTSSRMYEVMDLCIECKACKAECPSSVDMAKIKFEFLAQYYEVNPTPLRARLFGDVHRLNQLGSGRLSQLANWSLGRSLVKGGMNRYLGITSKRSLPPFARTPFDQWFKRRMPAVNNHVPVALFVDSPVNYNYPHIGIAAVEVLEAAGFRVVLPAVGDEGRASISKGLVEKARAAAVKTVETLFPFTELGMPIVGLEPSSLLALKEEYLYILPGDPRAQAVADHALTFEEFLASKADEGEIKINFTDREAKILLHGHCHQKALIGTAPCKQALSLPPNYQVEEVDSGCCGMAGAFGYETEHYDISMKMAERRLFPAIRETDPDTIIAAPGVSCRQQILHGTGRKALHPAEVLRAAIV